jgi:hypothetical protein
LKRPPRACATSTPPHVAAAVAATAAAEAARIRDAEDHAAALLAADEALAAQRAGQSEALAAAEAARETALREVEALRDKLREATGRAERAQRKQARDVDLLDRARRALEIAAALVEETQRAEAAAEGSLSPPSAETT